MMHILKFSWNFRSISGIMTKKISIFRRKGFSLCARLGGVDGEKHCNNLRRVTQ
jgi:hypothetical protein